MKSRVHDSADRPLTCGCGRCLPDSRCTHPEGHAYLSRSRRSPEATDCLAAGCSGCTCCGEQGGEQDSGWKGLVSASTRPAGPWTGPVRAAGLGSGLVLGASGASPKPTRTRGSVSPAMHMLSLTTLPAEAPCAKPCLPPVDLANVEFQVVSLAPQAPDAWIERIASAMERARLRCLDLGWRHISYWRQRDGGGGDDRPEMGRVHVRGVRALT